MLLRAQGEERGKMSGAIFEEITAENFPKVIKDIIIPQIQEALQIPSSINKKRSTLRHISFKRLLKTKDEEKILKAARGEKKMDYLKKGAGIRHSADLPSATVETRRQ